MRISKVRRLIRESIRRQLLSEATITITSGPNGKIFRLSTGQTIKVDESDVLDTLRRLKSSAFNQVEENGDIFDIDEYIDLYGSMLSSFDDPWSPSGSSKSLLDDMFRAQKESGLLDNYDDFDDYNSEDENDPWAYDGIDDYEDIDVNDNNSIDDYVLDDDEDSDDWL